PPPRPPPPPPVFFYRRGDAVFVDFFCFFMIGIFFLFSSISFGWERNFSFTPTPTLSHQIKYRVIYNNHNDSVL
ncbi:hypothetical protein, partial [Enterobacter hormaechei]